MPARAKDPAVSDDVGLREFAEHAVKTFSFSYLTRQLYLLIFSQPYRKVAGGAKRESCDSLPLRPLPAPSPISLLKRCAARLVNISLKDKERYLYLLNLPFSSYPSAPLTPSLSKGKV